jgi:hypothetical protein
MKTGKLLSTLIIALFSLHTLQFTARADPTLHANHPMGGTAEAHARAEQDSWQKMLAFLERSLTVRK